jgi:ketosteroid isomerase-like protein
MKRVLIAAALVAAAAASVAAQTRARPTTYQQAAERQLIALVEDWGRAARAADARALDRLLADDFTATTTDGRLKSKKEYIADFTSGARKIDTLTFDNFVVRVHGGAAAITHGGTLRGSQDGRDASGRYRWTHFFVRRGARWRCVATQATRLAQQQ